MILVAIIIMIVVRTFNSNNNKVHLEINFITFSNQIVKNKFMKV